MVNYLNGIIRCHSNETNLLKTPLSLASSDQWISETPTTLVTFGLLQIKFPKILLSGSEAFQIFKNLRWLCKQKLSAYICPGGPY